MKTLLSLLFCAALATAAQTGVPFESAAPAGWIVAQEKDGVTYLGPRDAHKLTVQINVRYIAPGNPSYADADAYLARLLKKPEFKIPGWKKGPIEQTLVAGRKARRARLESSEFVPPHSRKTKEVAMSEEHVVVPASKGFFVLLYYAPKTLAAKNHPVFQKVLDGFKPKL